MSNQIAVHVIESSFSAVSAIVFAIVSVHLECAVEKLPPCSHPDSGPHLVQDRFSSVYAVTPVADKLIGRIRSKVTHQLKV